MRRIESALLGDIEKLKTGDGCLQAGLPYFQGIYGRDALVSAWQLLRRDPDIARRTLRFLAMRQGRVVDSRTEEEPGRILHVHDYAPANPVHKAVKLLQRWAHGFPYYGSVDATVLFVIVAGETFRATGDADLIAELWPNVERAMEWIARFGDRDGDGLVEYRRRNPFGLRNQSWKDTAVYLRIRPPVAAVEVQGYMFSAYLTAASLAERLGRGQQDWRERAERLRAQFTSAFWMEDARFFAVALDGSKSPVKEIASNSGHLLFTGILDQDKAAQVVARLFQPDMLTEYGLRTHSAASRHFRKSCTLGAIWPWDNWVVWLGLKRCGYHEHAERLKECLLQAYRQLGRLPEYYDVVGRRITLVPRILGVFGSACCPQAWSSGALLNMLED